MTRLPHIEPGTADASTEELFATARRQIGGTPNMTQAMANSPAAQRVSRAVRRVVTGRLRPAVREQIALAIAQPNGCDYCMSAHTFAASLDE